nr:hypothetical protein GCM10017611_56120 [Rhodococcus wratislaviensis]
MSAQAVAPTRTANSRWAGDGVRTTITPLNRTRLTEWIVDNLRERLDHVAMAALTRIPVADSEETGQIDAWLS